MGEWAAKVVDKLSGGAVLLLYGELGSGKTTFTQGVARRLGIIEPVTSPTYNIVAEYFFRPAVLSEVVDEAEMKINHLVHVDLYRLELGRAANDPAMMDVLEQAQEPGRLTIIEWADRLGDEVPDGAQKIFFEYGKTENERLIRFKSNSNEGIDLK